MRIIRHGTANVTSKAPLHGISIAFDTFTSFDFHSKDPPTHSIHLQWEDDLKNAARGEL